MRAAVTSVDSLGPVSRSDRRGLGTPLRGAVGIPEPFASPPLPRRFGRHELLLEIARGGMATLYLGRNLDPVGPSDLVAIKVIPEERRHEGRFMEMFRDEARLTAAIDHPNVARILDAGEQDGCPYLVLEYIDGVNLAELLLELRRRGRRLPWPLAARIGAELAAALHAAHCVRQGDGTPLRVVHRDVSPQNILIGFDGRVKLIDFGIALSVGRTARTAVGFRKGKLMYMSPEQVRGLPLDHRSDIFSLGAVLYEACLGHRAFCARDKYELVRQVARAEFQPPRACDALLPVALENVMLKALARDPAARFWNAALLEQALREILPAAVARSSDGLGRLASSLFAVRRGESATRISAALDFAKRRALVPTNEVTPPPPDPAGPIGPRRDAVVHLSASAVPQNADPSASGSLRPPGRSVRARALFLGMALGLLAFILAVGFLLTRRATPPGTALRASVSPVAPPSPASQRVRLRVNVRPPAARAVVVFRGIAYRTRRFVSAPLAPDSNRERIIVRAPGFVTQRLDLVLDRAIARTVRLRRAGLR